MTDRTFAEFAREPVADLRREVERLAGQVTALRAELNSAKEYICDPRPGSPSAPLYEAVRASIRRTLNDTSWAAERGDRLRAEALEEAANKIEVRADERRRSGYTSDARDAQIMMGCAATVRALAAPNTTTERLSACCGKPIKTATKSHTGATLDTPFVYCDGCGAPSPTTAAGEPT